MTYTGIQIADIHFGAMNAENLYHELSEGVIKYIDSYPKIDFICILGDLIDKKISLNSRHAYFLMKFISDLVERCRKRNIKLRIIKGTESHDNKQLDLLSSIVADIDCKIINTVEKEFLFPDFKVLYIPEEYMKDKDEYYRDYFSEKYNMIFGHGMIKEASFHAIQQESEITVSSSPIFDTTQLLSITDGPIFFGHIHKSMVVRKDFIYVGSYSRWCFGEDEEKGFYITSYNMGDKSYIAEFIENKICEQFSTVEIKESSSLFNMSEIASQIKFIQELIDTFTDENLRIKINIPEGYENAEVLSYTITTAFSKYSRVKFKIINNNKLRKTEAAINKINILIDKYGFLFEKSISYEEKIHKFIRERYNKDISISKISDYIHDKLK